MLWALFIMGAVAIYMVGRGTNWFRRWRNTGPELECRRENFSTLMSERLGCALRSAEVDKAIIDSWDECPMEYRPYLYQVIRQSQILEESLIEDAMQKGIYPSRVTTRGQEIPPPPRPAQLPKEPVAAEQPKSNVVTLAPRHEWISGQLLRYG